MNEVSHSTRDKVFALEAELYKLPQLVIEPVHRFSPGVYSREITIPAGVTLTGEIHKYPQLNILSFGTMQVLTEDGIVEVSAPFSVVSPAGTKRVAHTLTECVWTTILATELTDVAQIENHFIAKSEVEYLTYKKNKCLS
ncbi:hypothetical protein [Bradyrhizobium erythrophlei]|uniref:Uncharacterized protein n=1 Tax=Bradyrhizobium erythrophlei TaxID=1437360 RepID=A0A1M5T7E1_9BRAD|nr:hypothetical protein [Bradyrhizobium erythrophlei]SHH46687.1 hypothetical protein SAMN05444169_7599 [Bradyrhizobium erythrophlei]